MTMIEYRAEGPLMDESSSRRARRVQPKLALDESDSEEGLDLRDTRADPVEFGMRMWEARGDL